MTGDAVHLNRAAIEALAKDQRVALINSLTGFKAACLVGTVDATGRSNLAIFNSAVHIGTSPPLIGLILRPDSVPRHTLDNIRSQRVYTLNHVREDWLAAAHQTSARYARDESEFDATGLTPEYWDNFKAPAVGEALVRIGLTLREELAIRCNGTHLLIGEVMRVELPDAALLGDMALDAAAAGSIAVSGLNTYYRAQRIAQLPYARRSEPTSSSGIDSTQVSR
ncbi:MAG: flavin reductase [Halieaceae bacterium]|jgi:flavin reductase (DIM6/NTAB) family NADH-FMN oxidoreductase RutF|nr:flavin reductase [Halieaceae bacterium]